MRHNDMSIEPRNLLRQFDPLVRAALGIYVYALIDPATRKVFYVGKGGGQFDGPGNSRLFDHFHEAEKSPNKNAKVKTINDVWSAGKEVEWQIIRHSIKEEEAFQVEAALIDCLTLTKNGAPDNDQSGHGVEAHGHKSPSRVLALGAPPVNPITPCNVFIFPIGVQTKKRGGIGRIRDHALYRITRRCWHIGRGNEEITENVFAVGIVDGISYSAYAVKRWKKEKAFSVGSKGRKVTKYAFHRCHNPSSEQRAITEQLLRKNWRVICNQVKGYMQRGGVIAVKFEGNGFFRYLRPRSGGGPYRC